MQTIPLFAQWQYNNVDRAFWTEHLEDWLPTRLIDAHTHVMDPRFQIEQPTEAMRRQFWVNEVPASIDADTAAHCMRTVFPNREITCVAFGLPGLDFDIDAGNAWLQHQCARRGWHNLVVVRPQWSQEKVATLMQRPGVIGVKPYYALISRSPNTRDEHLETSIFDFLPDHLLEVVNERHAWVTLHVPRAARLGHPENIREIREIRRRYPHIILVIAHLGRCYTEAHAQEALPQLAEDPGIYFDSSAVMNPASHRVALACAGPSRILYGTDNPIFYMRGRREFKDRTYLNRTNYPFHFNQQREPPEVEAKYTLYMYEDLRALKQACQELGLAGKDHAQAIFHGNAARLIETILLRKQTACGVGAPRPQ